MSPSDPLSVQIPAEEIVALLRRVIDGKTRMQAVGESWIEVFAGDVTFRIDGYTVVIFNDCYEVDYVDHAIAPDGRQATYQEWTKDGGWEPIGLMARSELFELQNIAASAEVIDASGPDM